MTPEAYAAIDAINWSTLKELRRSPLHYQHRLRVPKEDAPHLILGRAVHCAVFEPDELPLRYAVYAASKSRGEGARKQWEAFQAANAGRTILSAADWRVVTAIRDAVRSHGLAREYLALGQAERVIQWTDPATSLRCKARLDWISQSRGAICDLKTARDISPRRFAGSAASLGYHGQLAFYAGGHKAACGVELDPVLIAVESGPPHDVVIYRLDDAARDEGAAMVAELLAEVATRRQSGCWPGIDRGEEQVLYLPRWALPDDEDAAGLGLTFGGEQ